MDEEIAKVIRECGEMTKKVVEEHEGKIKGLAEKLIELETIDTKVIQDVLGVRPFEAKRGYKKYLEEIKNE